MSKLVAVSLTILFLLPTWLISVHAEEENWELICEFELETSGEETGQAIVGIFRGTDDYMLYVKVRNATYRDNPYTVWVDHRSRATGELAEDYPLKYGALARGVAPAFATNQGVYAGMLPDKNSFVVNRRGFVGFHVMLDYNILAAGASPVVSAGLATQGQNIISGGWLRQYEIPTNDPNAEPSAQKIDPETGRPLLHRSTAQGITIVWHLNPVTHGYHPGVGGVDHVPAWKGDFPAECMSR